jgi:hypothetical protein
MTNRRAFLSILGGGVIVAAASGGWALTRDPTQARAAWRLAGAAVTDPRMRWMSWAILAPNPHNRQPWLVDLRVPNEITLWVDLDRGLPDTDPFDRQITIGLGAFLELARMAAAEDRVRLDIHEFPHGLATDRLDARPVARLTWAAGAATPDPLFSQVGQRRTNRAAFDTTRMVPASSLTAIVDAARPIYARGTAQAARVSELRDIVWRAMVIEMNTPATAKENIALTRIGKAEIEANPDGISLSGPFLEGLSITGLLSREGMADPKGPAFRSMMDAMKPSFDTAQAFMWIATDGNDRHAQIAAGRSYLRANLTATGLGVAMQPLSQALQEYPEMAGSYRELSDALAPPAGFRVQMLARLGFAPSPAASPRWPLATRIRQA